MNELLGVDKNPAIALDQFDGIGALIRTPLLSVYRRGSLPQIVGGITPRLNKRSCPKQLRRVMYVFVGQHAWLKYFVSGAASPRCGSH